MDSIGVGIVGCGFVGRGAHVPAFAEIEGAELVAIADSDDQRRDKIRKKYALQESYYDYAELIRNPSIDLVVVSVPTPLHAEVATAAMEAGKHVLCEMPLAVTVDAAESLIATAQRQGVILMPSLTFRFAPTFVKAKELIEDETIGDPVSFRYREFIPAADLARQWPAGSWMWRMEQSGGPLFTLAVWSIDLFRWLTKSEVENVASTVKYTPLSQWETTGYDCAATIRFTNGSVGMLEYSGSVPQSAAECSLEVVGDAARVVKTWDNDRVALLGDNPTRTEWNVRAGGAHMWGHLQQDEHLVESIRNGRQPDLKPADGLKAMMIADQLAGTR